MFSSEPRRLGAFLSCAFALSLQACGSPSNPYQLGTTPAKVLSLGGDYQSGAPSASLPLPLVVKVVDADGRPVPQVTVQWRTASGDAKVSPPSETTDIGGKASATVVLGTHLGISDIQARVAEDTTIGVLFSASVSGNDSTGTLPTTSLDVTVGDNYFDPATLNIRVGQTVKWVWMGNDYHYVTFADTTVGVHNRFQSGGVWYDFGVYGKKGFFWSWTFTKPGTFSYYDNHFGTGGTIVVQQ